MWALIEDNAITKIINQPKGMVIGDIRYSRKIFSLWSQDELEAKGIYEVVFDNSNKKDEAYYNNTNQSFNYADGQVTASYGSATPKELNDVTDENDVVTKGLKTQHKKNIKQQASGLLAPTDWYVLKATDVAEYSVPSAVATFRTNVRTKSNEMETAIDNASDVDALAALYVYNDDEPPTRPLGELPTLEI
tara:strand:- start:527 stop:1099 length:573 start_codon:yes stop_codon:yes gene_type:complete